MAGADPARTLRDELSCPVCLEYFAEPVSLGCDHTFCRACIARCWAGSRPVSCPQCRQSFPRRKLKPSRQLGSIVGAVRALGLPSPREARTGRCARHGEPLRLFCREHGVPICLVCERSREHRAHALIPAEEAAEEFKETIQGHLKTLREEKEKLAEIKLSGEKRTQECMRKSQTEMAKIKYVFDKLIEFLGRQEQDLLRGLPTLEEDVMIMDTCYCVTFSEEISRLSELITDVEEKCQKPASEFLQDVRSILSRCEKRQFEEPEVNTSELEKKVNDVSQKTVPIMETIKTFKDTLLSALEGKGQGSLASQDKFAVTVTLDPNTAHPWLVLSEDGRSARCPHESLDAIRGDTQQEPLENPERFDTSPCVLGREGFTSGRHSWEVEVELDDGKDWAVGVARASVKRKGEIGPSSEGGIWAVKRSGSQFHTFSSPETLLPNSWIPSKIRVYLDFYQEQVTFFDADDEALIFTLPLSTRPGERLHPWFWVGIHSRFRLYP